MERAKLDALTGLRFIAAGMIVVHHSRSLQIPVPNYALDHGVSFFFVLSGFIIAYAYPQLDSARKVFDFLIARVARIWPAHFAALLFVVLLFQKPLDRTFLANALLVHGWIPSWPWYFSYNAPSWSISTELFFYIAFPVLIFRWGTSWWWKWVASALLVMALIWLGGALHLPNVSTQDEPTLHGLLFINPLARLFEFVTGMVAYSAFRALRPISDKLSGIVFTLLEISIITLTTYSIVTNRSLVMLAPYFPGAGLQWLGHASDFCLFPFVIIVFAFGRGWLSRLLSIGPMILLGEISYSIYLLHQIVFFFYRAHFETNQVAPDYLGLAICVATTLALAFAMWAAIEVPCRAAAKHWLKDRSLPTSMRRPSIASE